MTISKLIQEFLDKYAIEATDNESSDYIELMMDDHSFIEYKDKEYYIPENNSLWTEDESELADIIKIKYEAW